MDKKEIELPVNPEKCWNFFLLYIVNTLFTFFNIIYLIQRIIRHANIGSATEAALSNIQILQSSFLSFSILGYVIFQIPCIIAAMQHIFEEVSPTVSFKKSVNWIIRSQWFLPLFYFSLILTKNYMTIVPVQFVLILFSMLVDLLLNRSAYDKSKNKVLQIFSFGLAIMLVPFCNYTAIFSMFMYKVYLHYLNKSSEDFLKKVEDEKTKIRMKLLGAFTVINMILMIFVVTNNFDEMSNITSEESQVFQTLTNFFKTLLAPNAAKIITFFMV